MDNETRQQLTEHFIDLVEFLTRVLHVEALEEWRSIDMTIPQIKTMVLLQSVHRVRMGGIANYLGSTLSASTSIVDRLVDKGLVDRTSDPDDRRVVVCQLTESGYETINRFWQIESFTIDPIVQRLDSDQLENGCGGSRLDPTKGRRGASIGSRDASSAECSPGRSSSRVSATVSVDSGYTLQAGTLRNETIWL